MPQLGFESFVSQYFWLVVIFFTLYFIMVNKLIPLISETIKARNNLDTKIKVQKSIVKDTSLIKEIASLKFNPSLYSTSYNATFSRSFISWANKF